MILDNRRVTIDEVACHLRISHDSAQGIIHDQSGFHKVCARWVPNRLTGTAQAQSFDNQPRPTEQLP
jgi:hypothetical protein